jgi:hypothetical protein
VRGVDVYRILQPYISVRLQEQIKAVVPLALYLVLFQLLILKQNITDAGIITSGIFSVIIGLMFFMEGLKVGLMPFGETLGTVLPAIAHLPVVIHRIFTRHRRDVCRTRNRCAEDGRFYC